MIGQSRAAAHRLRPGEDRLGRRRVHAAARAGRRGGGRRDGLPGRRRHAGDATTTGCARPQASALPLLAALMAVLALVGLSRPGRPAPSYAGPAWRRRAAGCCFVVWLSPARPRTCPASRPTREVAELALPELPEEACQRRRRASTARTAGGQAAGRSWTNAPARPVGQRGGPALPAARRGPGSRRHDGCPPEAALHARGPGGRRRFAGWQGRCQPTGRRGRGGPAGLQLRNRGAGTEAATARARCPEARPTQGRRPPAMHRTAAATTQQEGNCGEAAVRRAPRGVRPARRPRRPYGDRPPAWPMANAAARRPRVRPRPPGRPAGVRDDFAETVYWHPVLVLPDGKAEVSFDLCDSVTTFEVTAFAHTLDGRLGSAVKRIESRLPFSLRPSCPSRSPPATASTCPSPSATPPPSPQRRRSRADRPRRPRAALRQDQPSRSTLAPEARGRRVFSLPADAQRGHGPRRVPGQGRGRSPTPSAKRFRVVPDGFPVAGRVERPARRLRHAPRHAAAPGSRARSPAGSRSTPRRSPTSRRAWRGCSASRTAASSRPRRPTTPTC